MNEALITALGITGIGQFLTWIWDVLKRDRESKSSPVEFNIKFYLKDNRIQLPASILMALLLTAAVYIMKFDVFIADVSPEVIAPYITGILHFGIGVAPAAFFTYIKRISKSSLLRPDVVKLGEDVYKRKDDAQPE